MTTLRIETLTMPGVRLGEENPLPRFRDRSTSLQVPFDSTLPAEKQELLGWETGFRVLPYRLQDNYSRERTTVTFRTLILENENLQATFLPELGGRLISLFHKPRQRELLCRNPVFQPANLAIRNAWFSGGIEWNIGQVGHTFSTCSPIFAAAIRGNQEEPGLRIYEFERCKRLFWQIDFYLPPDSPWLIAHTRIANPWPDDASVYWWTNIAVPEERGTRVLAPANQAIYADLSCGEYRLALGELPYISSLNGRDATYSLNSTFANEFFFQPDETGLPWEAALDQYGSGLLEASTPRLRYRKLFCWGSHQGGRHWQEFLSPGGKPYNEIQAGLAPTQLHGLVMPAGADWHWTQIFGLFETEATRVHNQDWKSAWKYVDAAVNEKIGLLALGEMDREYSELADNPAETILQTGSGWGALELERRSNGSRTTIPASFVFPKSTLGAEQERWLTLLREGGLPEQPTSDPPGEWMVQEEWRELLEKSLKSQQNHNWFAFLHLGIMRLEHFDAEGAKLAWKASISLKPSSLAWRNLAVLEKYLKNEPEALNNYHRAWELEAASGRHTLALAQEYLKELCDTGEFELARRVFDSLPADQQNNDRIQILLGRIALESGELELVEQVLQHEYAVVREGETELTDLWFEVWYRRMAKPGTTGLDDETRKQIRSVYPPPARIDFRSIAS